MTGESPGPIHLPARDIPIPSSLSPEARQVLAMGSLGPVIDWPSLHDVEAWKELVRLQDETVRSILDGTLGGTDVTVAESEIDGIRVFVARGERTKAEDRRVYLDVHGGAWAFQGGAVCRLLAMAVARSVDVPVWSVDYRQPPDHPWPYAVDDCLVVYRSLLKDHESGEMAVGGTSAGGNIAAAMILKARDEGLPLPAAAVLNTPASDLTASGDTWKTNVGLDNILTGTEDIPMQLYAGGQDLRDPLVSPLFGDFSKGFPATILTTGTRDLFLSDTVRMHRALRTAGIEADLHVWEAAGHGLFLGMAPEDADREAEIQRFLDKHWVVGSE
jgi:monoterpene epsilon-lactone hydrolase